MNSERLALLRQTMQQHHIPALHLVRPENIAWLTSGRSHVALMGERGVLEAWISQDQCVFVSNNIEANRLMAEEGIPEIAAYLWWDAEERQKHIGHFGQVVSDVPALPAPLEALRQTFEPQMFEVLRQQGKATGEAISRAARALTPHMTEFEAAGILAGEVYARGMSPVVVLVAGFDRLQQVRHPLPTHSILGKQALLVLCSRMQGVVLSASRLVSFEPVDASTRERYHKLLHIEARGLEACQVGLPLSGVFAALETEYAAQGIAEEIRLHHQGGLAGYRPRESRAEPSNTTVIPYGSLIALNPSCQGLKVEDTFLLHDTLENLTLHDWDSVEVAGRLRPKILEWI